MLYTEQANPLMRTPARETYVHSQIIIHMYIEYKGLGVKMQQGSLRGGFVDLLLRSASLIADISGSLLCFISRQGSDDRILVSSDAVGDSLDVLFGLSGVVLSLARRVLLFARGCPRLGASEVADGLNDGAFERMELACSFAWFASVVGHD